MIDKDFIKEDNIIREIPRAELEALVELSEYALFIAKAGSEVELIYANDKFYSMLQYTQKEYNEKYGSSFMGSVFLEEKQKVRNLIARQAAAGGVLKLEYRAMRRDGSIIWIMLSAKSIMVDGEMLYYSSCMDITESKRVLDELYNAKRELDIMANSIPGCVIKVRMMDFKLIYANDDYYLMTGYTRGEFHMEFGDYCDGIIHRDDIESVTNNIKLAIENHGLLGFECRIIAKDKERKWLYVTGRRIGNDDGEPVYLCVLTDITLKKNMEMDFEDNVRRAELIAESFHEMIWTYDIKSRRFMKHGDISNTYGRSQLAKNLFDISTMITIIHPDDIERYKRVIKERMEGEGRSVEYFRIKNDNGNFQKVEFHVISVSIDTDNIPDKIYGVVRIVSDRSEDVIPDMSGSSNKLITMARSAQAKSEDNVTDLMPYASFLSKTDKILKSRNDEDHYAIACTDINEFHKFNHQYGFSISNNILKIFSKVLLDNIAKGGMCSRVDGDYFVVMFKYANHKELMSLMSGMVRSKEEFDQKEGNISFGTTTGIYLVQPEDHELTDMLEKADLARRSIKGLMGNHYAIYTDDLQKERFKDEKIVDEIYNAIRNRSIEVCYMPRIYKNKENVIGCKAVPRVLLKDGQYMESVKLLKFIERGGKLNEFAFVSLSSVCCNMGAWKKLGNKTVPLSIEMTASELSVKNAVEIIDDIVVKKNGLDPGKIIFEIHERYFSEGTTVFDIAIDKLCKRGYQVVISRFGSDHTAIDTIRRLPVTGIKFHGGYFNEKFTNEREKIVLSKVVEMAKDLGLTVACGGIQTKTQEDFAKAIGCEVFEGDMYYGKVRNNVFERCFLSN